MNRRDLLCTNQTCESQASQPRDSMPQWHGFVKEQQSHHINTSGLPLGLSVESSPVLLAALEVAQSLDWEGNKRELSRVCNDRVVQYTVVGV